MEVEIENSQLDKCSCKTFKDFKNIPTIEDNSSYNYFFQNFLIPNKPCLISKIDTNWKSKTYWVSDKEPNFNYLSNKYGDKIVIVYNCNEKYYNSQKTTEWNFNDYLDYWRNHKLSGCTESAPLYLKDWHLKLQEPTDNFYQVPKFFSSDWLNEYFEANCEDDYKFVYMGPKGTWTPFHKDVFTSYSWSTNICGQKKWIFFPPGEENKLKDSLGNIPYDILNQKEQAVHVEIIQNPGDAIFVPSGWYHQVWNTQDTISINHNWINGCNVSTMWKALKDTLESVKNEISDCEDMDDWTNHCQIMLKAAFGLDFKMFLEMLKFVAKRRIDLIKNHKDLMLFDSWILGKNHALFDLKCLKYVLQLMKLYDEWTELLLIDDLNKLLLTINEGLECSD